MKYLNVLNMLIKSIDRILTNIVLVAIACLILMSLYGIYDANATYETADLSNDILQICQDENFTIKELQEQINPDIIGWIKMDDTIINYPILIGEDNTSYLTYNYKKEYSTTGSVFLDYRNKNFNDAFSVIYAHNMNADKMFGGLSKYEKQDYLDSHTKGTLKTLDTNYEIEVYGFAVVSAYSDLYNLNLYSNSNNDEVIKQINGGLKTSNIITINKNDKLLLLSTCRGAETENRSVLLTRLKEITR